MLPFARHALIELVTWLPVISLIITVHELGHFWVARACGIAIERFSLGFGRALVSWRDRAGTEWRIAWIPLGGYVRFAGDENAASVPDLARLAELRQEIIAAEGPGAERKYFAFKPVWQRACVVAAGPLANFALSILIFAVLLGVFGQRIAPARIGALVAGSPAVRAGFLPGDRVVEAGDRRIDSFDDLLGYVAVRAGVTTTFIVERGGRPVRLMATLGERVDHDPIMGDRKLGSLGVEAKFSAQDYTHRTYGPVQALAGGVRETWDIVSTTVYYIGRLVTGQVSGDQLGGPLRTAQLSAAVATAAAHSAPDLPTQALHVLIGLVQLAAFISVGIGFMNLLPIPVLDGGHLVFYLYEAIARRPLGAAIQGASYRVGLALLLGLMLFATSNDLQHSNVFISSAACSLDHPPHADGLIDG